MHTTIAQLFAESDGTDVEPMRSQHAGVLAVPRADDGNTRPRDGGSS